MGNEKMNYCCDCVWAVKKGLFRKTWYCTCPQKNEIFGSHVFHPVTCKPMIKTPIACDVARFVGKEGAAEQHAVNLKHPCPNYKGELRHHPAIPPMKCPLPCPPLPERVEKAMEEHDAAYLMNQKQKGLEAENQQLKEEKKELIFKLKKTCNFYDKNANCPECGNVCKPMCSVFETIQKYDVKEREK
jgi:hypothetical protein